MMPSTTAIIIASRGSALALAQANLVLAQCRAAFPALRFELKIIKTTGDKLQTASLAQENQDLPKGLFTKELELALLDQHADLAVHSLKDLPTELPSGLRLGAVGKREDVRDVLIYRSTGYAGAAKEKSSGRGFEPGLKVEALPAGAVVASSSTRRRAQLLALNPTLKIPDIRGNVLTRLVKLAGQPEIDATILALAGLKRLNFNVASDGILAGKEVPEGLRATILDTDIMLPCVGQGAIGIEVRVGDDRLAAICEGLNHLETLRCVTAERAFLSAMGGGCQSPVAAHAEMSGSQLRMRVLSFTHGPVRRADGERAATEAVELGRQLAAELLA